ncbi:MAG: L-asparaginase [Pseudonocardiales bacterium]|nr:L-asparaginase [Pseudonocardiales bacterium]
MIVLPSGEPLIEVERSGVVESVHRGHVVVMDASGRVVFSLGVPSAPMFPRSCNKPLQAVGLLDAGVVLTQPQLALAAASHSGEPMHIAVVRSTLASAGVSSEALLCPADLPLGVAAAHALLASGGSAAPIYMNCSGKHAAMLALCALRGWPLADYLSVSHPLEVSLASVVSELASEPLAATGVDGCGAPLFALSLVGLAGAFLRIASGSGSLGLVADAMRAHPELVGGTGRLNTQLMSGIPGLIAKDGADGVFAAALPGVGAVALKIDDGAQRAADVAVVGALRMLGISAPVLDSLAETPVLGGGVRVGSIRVRAGVLPS